MIYISFKIPLFKSFIGQRERERCMKGNIPSSEALTCTSNSSKQTTTSSHLCRKKKSRLASAGTDMRFIITLFTFIHYSHLFVSFYLLPGVCQFAIMIPRKPDRYLSKHKEMRITVMFSSLFTRLLLYFLSVYLGRFSSYD